MEAKRDTKSVGDASEAALIALFVQAGYLVSIPFGENHRYDLIVDGDEGLKRIQVKTGRLRHGSIVYNCCSSHAHHGGPTMRRYVGEIDSFAVFCPELATAYLVPIDEAPRGKGYLRIDPAVNCQRKRVRWAEPYKFGFLGAAPVGLSDGSGVQGEAPKLPL